jgi:hypothetical protein
VLPLWALVPGAHANMNDIPTMDTAKKPLAISDFTVLSIFNMTLAG